ncbi:hypothetical protein BDZ89DRAFT_311637 [Hymenopellis radicata]|nr:hypothetical protein BDZ89DRAFT_311637 [Hymenopellis radicata]
MVVMDMLPQELIDAILDELASDAEALKSASLVCRAFYPRCQKLLFSAVTLEPKESSTHNPALSFRTLLGSTTISRLVNSLTIYNFTRGRTSWFSQDRDVIPGILSTLPNLRELMLSGRHYDRRWDGSSDMNASLCASFSRPRVRSLTLVYMSFLQPSDFALLLSNSPDLTSLRLLNVYISDQFTMQLPVPEYEGVKRSKLRTLAIQNVPLGLLDILRSTVDLSALRKLQFWSDHGDQSGHSSDSSKLPTSLRTSSFMVLLPPPTDSISLTSRASSATLATSIAWLTSTAC